MSIITDNISVERSPVRRYFHCAGSVSIVCFIIDISVSNRFTAVVGYKAAWIDCNINLLDLFELGNDNNILVLCLIGKLSFAEWEFFFRAGGLSYRFDGSRIMIFISHTDDIDSLSLFQCYRVCVRVFLKSKVRNSIALAVIYELCCINADICLDNGVSFRKCGDNKNVITITVWVETHISLICFIYVLVYKDSSVCFAYCLDMCRIIVFRADKASLYHVICRRIADRLCCIAVRICVIILCFDIC